jgi:C4-dicarboxylate transporter DctM subunit
MMTIAIISLLIFLILGVPVCFAIGLSGILALIFGSEVPTFMAVQQTVRGMNSFPMMAGPFFILAGEILGAATLSARIFDFCRSIVSWLKGGYGFVCVTASIIFAGISGSGAASMNAVGRLSMPVLKKAGYKPPFIAAVVAGCGAIDPIIPPSVTMVVYGSLTGFSIGKLFIGGILPGLIIALLLMLMCFVYAVKHDVDDRLGKFDIKNCLRKFCGAFFALLAPIIIIGGVIGGVFTATEAGVVACVYSLACGLFIYRTIGIGDIIPILKRASASSAMLLMLMGISNIYSYIFARENVGATIANFLLSISANPTVIVAAIMGVMIVVGCFVETVAAMVIILPMIYPVVTSLGVDLLNFGVLFSISTVIGGLTPPVGLYLFLSMDITKSSFVEVIPYMYVVVGILLFVMVLMLFFPSISTFLPNLLMS